MSTIKIGWGHRELSMEGPVSLPGQMYMRISEGIHDPLCATALCVDGGEASVIFCTVDLVVLRGGVIENTKQKVKAMRPELPTEYIVMACTHTHAGGCVTETPEKTPDGQEIFPGDQYNDFFCTRCAEAICEAWDSRKEGGMAYGYGYAVVAHSRRTCYSVDMSTVEENSVAPNGHAVMYGSTKKPQFTNYEAGADHFLNAMYTFDGDNKLTGIVINVPCPSQLSEHFTKMSADYWNEVRQMVKKEFGEQVYVLPQCAAAGDLSPRVLHYREAQARRMGLKYDLPYDQKLVKPNNSHEYNKVMGERYDIAERILDAVKEIYSWASKDIQTEATVCHVAEDYDLSRRMISDEEKTECEENIAKMLAAIPDPATCTPEEYRVAASTYKAIKGRNERAIARYETQEVEPTLQSHVHVIRIGEIAFATTRFELYMDFMHRLQARSPFIQTFVIQLAGDEGGNYLATERAKNNKGYSASLFCNMVGPEGGQEWVEKVLTTLNEMADK